MKYFACSDIHSFYHELMDALDEAGFDINNDDHHIILCGDLLDRGNYPRECLRFVNDLIKKNRITCIMGNHEDLMNDLLIHKWPSGYDYHNGTKYTVDELVGESDNDIPLTFPDKCRILSTDEDWCRYYNECKNNLYLETDHYIFVHSYVPYDYYTGKPFDDWRDITNLSVRSAWLHDAIWANPYLMWSRNNCTYLDGKTLVCGHWHTSYAHRLYNGYDKEFLDVIETYWVDEEGIEHPTCCNDIFYGEGIIGLDACTVVSHKVNVLVLDEL